MVGTYQPILNICKPIVVLIIYESARNNYIAILALVKNSSVILLCIFGYVAVASFLAYIMFQNSLEGYSFFMTPAIALYEMFICFTTSNFPNIMLPAYYENRWSSLFFVGFLIFGMFFLMNILLAAVIDNYKDRSVEEYERKEIRKRENISTIFDNFDEGEKSYLDRLELKNMFEFLLDQSLEGKSENKFQKIISEVDPLKTEHAYKKYVMDLVLSP